jgi:hypothetical protein
MALDKVLSTQEASLIATKKRSSDRVKSRIEEHKSQARESLMSDITIQKQKVIKYESIIRLLNSPNTQIRPSDLKYFNIIQDQRTKKASDEQTLAAAQARLEVKKSKVQELESDLVTLEDYLQNQEDQEFNGELFNLINLAKDYQNQGSVSLATVTRIGQNLIDSSIYKDHLSKISTAEHAVLLSELANILQTAISSKATVAIRNAIDSFITKSEEYLEEKPKK